MPFNSEISELKRRYNILREQNEKLQGSIKVLQATNENLSVTVAKIKEEKEKFKKAFETIFISNIGNAWEQYSDSQKQEMSIDQKISFFNREMNLSKLYIRQKMEERMADLKEENIRLKKELTKANAKLVDTEDKLRNASAMAKAGGPIASHMQNNLMNQDDSLATGDSENEDNVQKAGLKLNGVIGTLFGSKAPDSESKDNNTHTGAPNHLKKGKGAHSKDTAEQINKTAEAAKSTEDAANKVRKSLEEKARTATSAEQTKPINKPEANPEKDTPAKQTINFWAKFKQAPTNIQNMARQKYLKMGEQLSETPLAKEVLLAIGSTGEYAFKDVFQAGVNKGFWESSKESRVRRTITKLVEKDPVNYLVEGEEGESVGRGRLSKVYMLSPSGEAWYAMETNTDPMKSLNIVHGKEQKSVTHGNLISEMKRILDNAGYTTVQEVRIPTSKTGEYSIADISAAKGQDINIRIECEMGNYDMPGYIFKFRKALEVSDRLLVGVPKMETKSKIEQAIKELIREDYHGYDDFHKAGKGYLVFTTTELSNDPDLILPKKNRKEY